jgi:hypothetical protein
VAALDAALDAWLGLDASAVRGVDSVALVVATGTRRDEVQPVHSMTRAIAHALRRATAVGFT